MVHKHNFGPDWYRNMDYEAAKSEERRIEGIMWLPNNDRALRLCEPDKTPMGYSRSPGKPLRPKAILGVWLSDGDFDNVDDYLKEYELEKGWTPKNHIEASALYLKGFDEDRRGDIDEAISWYTQTLNHKVLSGPRRRDIDLRYLSLMNRGSCYLMKAKRILIAGNPNRTDAEKSSPSRYGRFREFDGVDY